MRLSSGVPAALILTALGWGCTPDSPGPSPTGLEASSVAGGDFDYSARPPHVQVISGTVAPDGLPFCRSGLVCYTPSFVRSAYNFPSTLNGAGQTILIVDAFGSPTVAQDLATFDALFHVPAPPSFTILCPDGCPVFAPNDRHHDEAGWSVETSLDVQYAHAMAPGANIVLVVASTSSGNAINAAEAVAIQRYPGSIMSQSFGIPEILVHANNAQILQAHKNYLAAQAAGYGGEQVWNEPVFGVATGGAPSNLFGVPSYQSGLGLTTRTIPDVAYNAPINGGVLVVWTAIPAQAGIYIVGGTSAGSPQWASVVALANQLKGGPVGFINPTLYKIGCSARYGADFHDITVGNNQLSGTPAGFPAATGWDDATGLGTPNVANLVQDLVTPPSCS